jgi:hypothetical protein
MSGGLPPAQGLVLSGKVPVRISTFLQPFTPRPPPSHHGRPLPIQFHSAPNNLHSWYIVVNPWNSYGLLRCLLLREQLVEAQSGYELRALRWRDVALNGRGNSYFLCWLNRTILWICTHFNLIVNLSSVACALSMRVIMPTVTQWRSFISHRASVGAA